MRNILNILCLLLIVEQAQAQSTLYFPDKTYNANWSTVTPASLGWCTNYLDTIQDYLDSTDSKGFIILQDGKIAYEYYNGTFTVDSFWYWASAGKTILALLTGVAQEEGYLSITDTTSKYLGNNWSSCPQVKQDLITIRNQLSMTTGLDDAYTDPDCQDPACLQYLSDAGTRWAYHNAPYLLLQDLLPAATGISFSNYTNTRLNQKTGMFGFWLDSTYYSRTRDMARYGLMILNKGIWNSDTLLHDSLYFHDMTNTSQTLNNSYGYLWWLNGKGSYMVPGFQFVFQSDLIPNAPSDMIAALGKNDQKIYIIPSQNRVIVRMGNSSGTPVLALSSFDNQIWAKLNQLFCNTTGIKNSKNKKTLSIYPNPVKDEMIIESDASIQSVRIMDVTGKLISENRMIENRCNLSQLPAGSYFILPIGNGHIYYPTMKIIKLPQ